MSPLGCQKMSAKPCNRNAEESFPVLSLKSREQKPPNPLLIQDKDVLQPSAGPLVCPECRQSLAGQGDATQGADGAAAAARMVLRCPAEAGHQAPSPPRRDLFSRLAGLGRELVAGHA